LVLAATLDSNYGIYGPAYELLENTPVAPGKEEYLNSEKYEVKRWDRKRPDSLRDLIARVNRVRRENPALQTNRTLRFHDIDNPEMIAYSKTSEDGSNVIVTVVNLDAYQPQSGWLNLSLDALKIDAGQPFLAHDLLGDSRFFWHGARNFISLDPHAAPAQIFAVRRRLKTERDFDYYM
jgi:starch synthase (maltosyl-transferring)